MAPTSRLPSSWSRDELTRHIAACKAAIEAALHSHAYGLEGRSLTRQNLAELRGQLAYYENELAALSGIGRGPFFVTARVRR